MRDQDREVNRAPHALAEKKNIPHMGVEINVANQKQCRRNHGGNHEGAVRGHATPGNHVAAGYEKQSADSVQTCDQTREVSVLFRDHAAGLLVRRFAIMNASANITSENKSRVAMAEGSGNCLSP